MSIADKPLSRLTVRGYTLDRQMLASALVLVVTLGVLPLGLAGWLLGGALVLALTIIEPLAALYTLPLAAAFGSNATLTVHGLHAGPTDLLLAALVLAWVVRAARTSRRSGGEEAAAADALPDDATSRARPTGLLEWVRAAWRRDRVRVAVFATLLLYLGVISVSLVVATNRVATVKEILKWSEATVLVALALWLVRSPRQVRVLAWAMIAAGLAEALLGYGQWVFASGALGPGSSIRVFGTFAQPNPYAGYLNLALPLALALALFSFDPRERWVAGAAATLMAGAEALANSRGGLLGLVAAVAVLVVVGFRRERLAAIVIAIGVPVVALAWVTHLVPERVQTALLAQVRLGNVSVCGDVTAASFSTVERVAHWVAGLRMFAAHPLLGVGAGNYDAAYAQYACADWPESLGHAHNYYINVAAETGLLGLIAFLAVVGALLWLGWRATHPSGRALASNARAALTRESARALALGLFAVIVAVCVHNLTDDLFVHSIELQVALCVGGLLRLNDLQ